MPNPTTAPTPAAPAIVTTPPTIPAQWEVIKAHGAELQNLIDAVHANVENVDTLLCMQDSVNLQLVRIARIQADLARVRAKPEHVGSFNAFCATVQDLGAKTTKIKEHVRVALTMHPHSNTYVPPPPSPEPEHKDEEKQQSRRDEDERKASLPSETGAAVGASGIVDTTSAHALLDSLQSQVSTHRASLASHGQVTNAHQALELLTETQTGLIEHQATLLQLLHFFEQAQASLATPAR
jgi:hypothetical protein